MSVAQAPGATGGGAGDPTAGAPPSSPAIREACPLCGAPLDPRQDWCLRCGAAARTRLAATPNWKAPAAAVAVVVALALGVLAAALVKLAGDSGGGGATTATTVTSPPAAAVPTTPAATSPSAPTATSPAPGTATAAPTVTAQKPNAGGIAGPGTTPTVTGKTRSVPVPRNASPKERRLLNKLLNPGSK